MITIKETLNVIVIEFSVINSPSKSLACQMKWKMFDVLLVLKAKQRRFALLNLVSFTFEEPCIFSFSYPDEGGIL